MAVENFIEMRDRVADKHFLLEKAVEHILQEQFPDRYIPRYALVTFSRVPYKFAYDAGVVQAGILRELCHNLARPEDVDLRKAEQLINERLDQFRIEYADN
jgi:kynurenine 3-monooxygenase